MAILDRRDRTDASPREGISPYVLSAAAGVQTMLLWLKLGGLVGVRDVSRAQFEWGFVVVAAVAGAILFLAVQFLWAAVTSRIAGASGERIPASTLRMVWGQAGFPQIVALVLTLPLDLLLVGSDSYTTARIDDTLGTAWAALSVALGVAFLVWMLFLLWRGTEATTGVGLGPAAGATAGGLLAGAVGLLAVGVALAALAGALA